MEITETDEVEKKKTQHSSILGQDDETKSDSGGTLIQHHRKDEFSHEDDSKLRKSKSKISESMMVLIAAIVGAVIAALAGIGSSLYVQKEQRSTEQIMLARTLIDSFDNNTVFSDIRSSIDSCEPIYIGYGGKYTHDQINRYFGFFEDLGFYSNKKKFLDLDVIGHLFGAHLVEAYSYPESRKYISQVQSHQPLAFVEFDLLFSRITKNINELGELAKNMENACNG